MVNMCLIDLTRAIVMNDDDDDDDGARALDAFLI